MSLASLKIVCKSYFRRHKMKIQIIHIFYYHSHGRFHVLDVEFMKSLKYLTEFLVFNIFHYKATNSSP